VRTVAVVARVLDPLKEAIHAARLKCMSRVISAGLIVGKVSLTALGRALETQGKTKHAIKRVDVLLGNERLVEDADAVQLHFAGLLANDRRPVLLIDWTDIGKLWTALVVTYVSEGRGLTLCWEVHPAQKKNSVAVEQAILSRIARLLPTDTKPILITDAGFRGPWLKAVTRLGWDFVGRVRGRVKVRSNEGQWRDVKSLWADAPRNPTDRGTFELARYKPTEARLVSLWPKRKQKRNSRAEPRVGRRTKRNIKAAREPLILATSLQNTITAKTVAELYALRWRIELTFRDQKCGRFGLGLDAIRTKHLQRARAYMLLAVLGHYVAFVLGTRAERSGLSRQFQANTVTDRRVLSLPRLGCELLRRTAQFGWLMFLPLPLPHLFKCGDP
jgi:hypothetical protein